MTEPIKHGACVVCGAGATMRLGQLGCLIALGWSTEVGGYRWAHRVCAERERLIVRPLPPKGARVAKRASA